MENIWIFGSYSGKCYNDNSKYLYEYIRRKYPCKKIFWITQNKKIYDKYHPHDSNFIYSRSLKSFFISIFSKCNIISYSYDDLPLPSYLFSFCKKIIQLHHGFPFKKSKLVDAKMTIFLRKLMQFFFGKRYDLIISTSVMASQKIAQHFSVPCEMVKITGYPRNDILFSKEKSTYLRKIKEKISFDKAILFVPTFREYKKNGRAINLFKDFGFDVKEYEIFLQSQNIIMLIKLHPKDYYENSAMISEIKKNKASRILFVSNEEIDDDIYPIMKDCDLLITDYSSIAFDYLLLNRPIVYSAFDLSEYLNHDRGFYFDFDGLTPGDKASNWTEMISILKKNLKEPNLHETERKKVSSLCNKFYDNNSSARCYEAIQNM